MKIALVTASISRQAGGLLLAVQRLAQTMAVSREAAVHVLSIEDEHTRDHLPQWGIAMPEVFDRFGTAAFGYAPGMANALERLSSDLAHTHGLWMYPSLAVQRWGHGTGKPWLVSPHGMLDPWAIRNARWKKRLAGFAYENRHLRGAACLHGLCEAEAQAFRAYGLANPIAIIPNGVDLPEIPVHPSPPDWAKDLSDGARILLFLGRLHPKKGLENLLRAWGQSDQAGSKPWILVVAGWDQNDHRTALERLVGSLGIAESVRFVGPQFGEEKVSTLMRADAFVLPSFSEGLPMSVLEAWAYGLPVLMTPQCNLPEGFVAHAAIRAEPEVGNLAQGLEALLNLSSSELTAMGGRGRALVESQFTWPHVASQMCDVYRWVLGNGPRPPCVRLE